MAANISSVIMKMYSYDDNDNDDYYYVYKYAWFIKHVANFRSTKLAL